ncbi:hypothetical protein CONCODRAFT_78563 [Conidiobolus coronatus NRRL 28638]|uniref:BZIP domain-containing protein n=1 Tax=Conidiobolus coronatus (strain ATCC 28846 / CBS 209.66 / NRRL 28638) TaxID=796925 RepID=A0A137P7S4_CONC2|nr:hypothetical protein CONCODRAFT_78563 [Conidiobolus coronatus NRRL 28638]|eukprot:KXN71042.1 hypothetical protein CONCODRAFT_78563 [Conidiobolus coronatus NRRL 28638]
MSSITSASQLSTLANLPFHSSSTSPSSDSNPPSSPNSKPTSGRKKKGSSGSVPASEKRQRRLLRNRIAAKECRRKKKQYVEELEERARILTQLNEELSHTVKELNAKITLGYLRYYAVSSQSQTNTSCHK